MMRTNLLALTLAAAAVMAGLAGCGDSGSKPAGNAAAADTLPETLFVTAAPANALDVVALKKDAKVGDEVVMTARVAGAKEPFAKDRAIVVVSDTHMAGCEAMGEDHCPTPWDMCCAKADEKVANSATVQVVGADGRPLKLSLNGQGGLKPDARIVVVGKVAARDPDGKVMTVNASKIHVKPAS